MLQEQTIEEKKENGVSKVRRIYHYSCPCGSKLENTIEDINFKDIKVDESKFIDGFETIGVICSECKGPEKHKGLFYIDKELYVGDSWNEVTRRVSGKILKKWERYLKEFKETGELRIRITDVEEYRIERIKKESKECAKSNNND